MAFDKNLDKELFSESKEFETTKVTVSVFSYNEGTAKLQIGRSNLDVESQEFTRFAKLGRMTKEEVEAIVLGLPTRLNGQDNEMTPRVMKLKEELEKAFPEKKIVLEDERFTSKMALQSMIAMGSKKKDRKEKARNLDKVSAAIIHQSYLEKQ